MREIKFRAWDDVDKRWLLGYDFPNLGGFSMFGECMLFSEYSAELGRICCDTTGKYKCHDLKLMQYTGIKDKNGIEIYECDIVSEPCHDCKNGVMISEVIFERGRFCKKDGFKGDMLHTELYGEVIGNIHENSELLKC